MRGRLGEPLVFLMLLGLAAGGAAAAAIYAPDTAGYVAAGGFGVFLAALLARLLGAKR